MDRPTKRRKTHPAVQISFQEKSESMGHVSRIQDPMLGNKDAFDKQLLHAAISDIPRAAVPSARKSSPLFSSQAKPKSQRLHPRNFIPYQAADSTVNPVVQPVETAVSSFINVVLDRGGTSVGNVFVPAASSVFTVDGYGPITVNKNPPAIATPSPQQQNPPSPAPSHPHRHTHASQPTALPVPKPVPQAEPTAAASQNTPVQQSPMSIQVPRSSSQIILSSPPTPIPPNPSNSTSTATGSESYFGTSSPLASSSTQTSSIPSTTSSQPANTSQSPQISNGGFGPTNGNFTTSVVTSSQTSSGFTTLPVIVTSSSNSTTVLSTSFSTFLTTSSSLTSTTTSSSSSSVSSTSSSSTTSPFSSSTSSSTSSSASVSSTSQGTGVPAGFGGPTGTAGTAGGPPSSSSNAAAGSGGGTTAPTPTIVGSVVGSVAGLALILILLLFFLRRRKRLDQQRTISPPIPQSASTGPGANTGTMTERSSAAIPLAGAGAGAGFFRRLRPGSGATATTTETTPSERGFQNLGGRRLESVLSSQGDGYGNVPFGAATAGTIPGPSSGRGLAPPAIPIITTAPGAAPGHSSPESLDGSSFYRDSQGFYGGPAQGQPAAEPPSNSSSMFVGPASPPQSPMHPPLGTSPEGIAVMRPGPARTPITTQPGLSPMRGSPRQQRGTPPPPHIPGTIQERTRDGLGRSHPSLDGSRSSRFAENI